jgi:6-phosphogluconolactonase/glucosamine-6-phosphate isomerase/deaminase
MKLNSFSSKTKVLEQASARLNEVLEQKKSKSILFLLSGGSSLDLLDLIDEKVLGSHVCICVSDERFSRDESVNNWLQVKSKSFYQKARNAGCEFIETVPAETETIEQVSQRWEKDLRDWVKKHPNRFTLATLGVGPDGHVAGISPFPDNPEKFVDFLITPDWIKGYTGNLTPPERITITAKFMEDQIDYGLVYVVGEGKKVALENILKDEGRMADTPARILREMKEIEIYTDIKVEL